VAVGEFRPGGRFMNDRAEHLVVMRFDGVKWSMMAAPAAVGTELNGVSCVSRSTCAAVGERVGGEGDSSPLIESMKGTRWSVVPSESPEIFSANANYLESVSCVSVGRCTAVGWDNGIGYGRGVTAVSGLIAQEGQSGWTVSPVAPLVPTPQGPGTDHVVVPTSVDPAYLMSVSCTPALCIAAGEGQSFVERAGTTWTPLAATAPLVLNGVSCSPGQPCIAVGSDGQGLSGGVVVTTSTSIASLSGSRWQRLPSPNTTSSSNVLDAVSCWAARSCVAVGSVIGPPQAQPNDREGAALVEVEAKGTWSLAKLPKTPVKVDDALTSVSCASPHTCIAVGRSVVNALRVPSGPIHALSIRVAD
jgi:hypothetical protein